MLGRWILKQFRNELPPVGIIVAGVRTLLENGGPIIIVKGEANGEYRSRVLALVIYFSL
jgi:hypothetical protein